VQQPRPPIIVGGTAKPRTVRAAVRFADEYNTVFPTVDEARERKQILDAAAQEAGRDPLVYSMMIGCLIGRDDADLERRRRRFEQEVGDELPPVRGTVEQVVAQLREYESVGVERVMLQHLMHDDLEPVGLLGEVATRLH
jgi:alkanesulfonate monooxygenase SsuD/methylene tetrahydromethanopterin reductase-like flavin-dependent oxidoreductase (luciferase family)